MNVYVYVQECTQWMLDITTQKLGLLDKKILHIIDISDRNSNIDLDMLQKYSYIFIQQEIFVCLL